MFSARYLFRRIARSPGFSSLFTLTIALAVGLNMGSYSIVHAVLYSALGIPAAEKLALISVGTPTRDYPLSGLAYQALITHPLTRDAFGWKLGQFRLTTSDGPTKLSGAFVTGNTFSTLGIPPAIGRFFGDAEDQPGGGPEGWTAVLGYSYWKTNYQSDRSVIGRTITLDGVPVRVIGVLPKSFSGVIPFYRTDILVPRHFLRVDSPAEDRFAYPGYQEWYVFSRLPDGMTIQELRSNLKSVEPYLMKMADPKGDVFTSSLFPDRVPGSILHVQEGRFGATPFFPFFRLPLLAMQALAGVVFAFCCCNLVVLLGNRAKREARATAIRFALGERVGDHLCFATLEVGILSLIGCLAAVPIAYAAAHALSIAIQSIPGLDVFPTVSPSMELLLSGAGVISALTCLAALASHAWMGGKRQLEALRSGVARGAGRSGSWFVGFEVLAATLLFSAVSITLAGLCKFATRPSGFDATRVATASIDLSYGTGDAAEGAQLKRVLEKIQQTPGVSSAATINLGPFSGSSIFGQVRVLEQNGAWHTHTIWPASVSSRYFSTVGTPIIQGRDFNPSDAADQDACILSANAAGELFPKEEAIGKALYQSVNSADKATGAFDCHVVGIAGDAHFTSMSSPPDPIVYRLWKDANRVTGDTDRTILVRAKSVGIALQAIRTAAQAVDPGILATPVESVASRMDDDLRVWRVISNACALCASLAAAILAIGFFGILSLQVSERKREIGIQIALGAGRKNIGWSLMRKLRSALLGGAVLGCAVSFPAGQALGQAYGLGSSSAWMALAASLLLLTLLMFAAAAIPMRRALAISPIECLASE